MAARLKKAGLPRRPHVGCFVWDRDEVINVPSPFPERMYFILNLGRFLEIFDTLEGMIKKLLWVATWNQAWLLCERMGITRQEIRDALCDEKFLSADDGLLRIYQTLLTNLRRV